MGHTYSCLKLLKILLSGNRTIETRTMARWGIDAFTTQRDLRTSGRDSLSSVSLPPTASSLSVVDVCDATHRDIPFQDRYRPGTSGAMQKKLIKRAVFNPLNRPKKRQANLIYVSGVWRGEKGTQKKS